MLGVVGQEQQRQRVFIFDTTLRDGEQSPGVTLTADEKVEIAHQLSRLRVDICEAGFPQASNGDFEAVSRIAREVGPALVNRTEPMVIAGLARATVSDIRRAYDAVKYAPRHRIHTFLATSDIHLQYKLRISREECIDRACAAVRLARTLCDDVEFSAEDAARSDRDFLAQVLSHVIAAGATTINVPDTVGYMMPEEYGGLIRYLIEHVEGAAQVVWSTHCHNDLGVATANTLAGVVNGCRQVEVAINGIGERAGNTALEEVVMALYTHRQSSTYGAFACDIDTTQLYKTSKLVALRTGMTVQPNKAIVGANAFAHESGIHQDGLLKHKSTYEIIDPAVVGITPKGASQGWLVLGKHSGRNAFVTRLAELGFEFKLRAKNSPPGEHDGGDGDDHLVDKCFARFKRTADTKKQMTDLDVIAIVNDEIAQHRSGAMPRALAAQVPITQFELESVQIMSGTDVVATAKVQIRTVRHSHDSGTTTQSEPCKETDFAVSRNGSIHAIFQAIESATKVPVHLDHYEVRSVSTGSCELSPDMAGQDAILGADALGEVIVKLRPMRSGSQHKVYVGTATETDVILASARAFLSAVNKLVAAEQVIVA
ncbi:2-isopropylmalate synthase (Alpha-isopropylmalate synthase) (Alpha-IPM synthetase) [Sorochytrium milnesiophthora]